jgi:nitric oxide reductase activation protein
MKRLSTKPEARRGDDRSKRDIKRQRIRDESLEAEVERSDLTQEEFEKLLQKVSQVRGGDGDE